MKKSELRSELRRRRNALSDEQQSQASRQLSTRFFDQSLHKDTNRIGFYWPADGEIDPLPLAHSLIDLGAKCYLPIIDSSGKNQLNFGEYSRAGPMRENRFGINEPQTAELTLADELDLILMPLVGFDLHGNRIGMGKGFYDRTLAGTGSQNAKPRLIGLAHQCQLIESIEPDEWDVPLNGILTDSGYYRCL